MKPHMRIMLLDWVMEVCNEFRFKRQTYHLAVYYIDRYLERTRDCPTNRL